MDDKIKVEFDRSWRAEALANWRLYLKQRQLVRVLRLQNSQLRKALYNILKKNT